jgi:hypothetical protein
MASTSAQRRREEGSNKRIERPTTPGRPSFFSFSPNHLYKKSVPSKWDDAEKWLVGTGSCHDSPLHGVKMQEPLRVSRLNGGLEKKGGSLLGSDKVLVEKPVRVVSGASGEVFLKGKLFCLLISFFVSAHIITLLKLLTELGIAVQVQFSFLFSTPLFIFWSENTYYFLVQFSYV